MITKRPATIAAFVLAAIALASGMYYAGMQVSNNNAARVSVLDEQDIDQIVMIKAAMRAGARQDNPPLRH